MKTTPIKAIPTPAVDACDGFDEDLEIWDQFAAAVRWLAVNSRPGLTYRTAISEAVTAWIGEQAALAHNDEPFQ